MGSLGKRERYYFMILGIVVAVLVIYFFGIRNLGYKYDELVAERQELQDRLDYYEALKAQNDESLAQINQLKTDIAEEEVRFLPLICAESIEQYVLHEFESAGCPYLVSVTAEELSPQAVTLPNGSAASDYLIGKRVSVQYSTTDGFNIPEYNRSVTVIDHGVIDEAAWNALLDEMYWHGADSIVGYDEFISALASIEQENPDCIKINSFSIESIGGYILLNAEIDFYSASFNDRVSEPDLSAPYITWAGASSINCVGGFIGRPFIIEDPNSEWFMYIMTDEDARDGDRPFATYYSRAIFDESVSTVGLEETLNLGAVQPEIPAEE